MGCSLVLYDNSIYKESIYLYLEYWKPIYEKRAKAHYIEPNQLLSKGNYDLIQCLVSTEFIPWFRRTKSNYYLSVTLLNSTVYQTQ